MGGATGVRGRLVGGWVAIGRRGRVAVCVCVQIMTFTARSMVHAVGK